MLVRVLVLVLVPMVVEQVARRRIPSLPLLHRQTLSLLLLPAQVERQPTRLVQPLLQQEVLQPTRSLQLPLMQQLLRPARSLQPRLMQELLRPTRSLQPRLMQELLRPTRSLQLRLMQELLQPTRLLQLLPARILPHQQLVQQELTV